VLHAQGAAGAAGSRPRVRPPTNGGARRRASPQPQPAAGPRRARPSALRLPPTPKAPDTPSDPHSLHPLHPNPTPLPKGGPFKYPVPRELTQREITSIVQAYADGAKNAVAAGFDGVEVCVRAGGWGVWPWGWAWRGLCALPARAPTGCPCSAPSLPPPPGKTRLPFHPPRSTPPTAT
jgi:hypothetical protein